MQRHCLNCNNPFEGRADKKYCSDYCKSDYNHQKNKDKEDSLFKKIDRQLKLNRKVLRQYNKAGKATVRKENMIEAGFNPNYFTHYWKNKAGDVYLFVYEFGFLRKTENGNSKFVLVVWQSYMER